MASAWGVAWGDAWGDAWGTITAGPPAPTGLAATALSQTDIRLTVVTADGAASFKIQRRSPPGGGSYTEIATGVAMPYTDSGLTTATAYEYRVVSTGVGGDSDPSDPASATTLAAPPTNFGPAPRRRGRPTTWLIPWRRR